MAGDDAMHDGQAETRRRRPPASVVKNGSNMRERVVESMPLPLSATMTRRNASSAARVKRHRDVAFAVADRLRRVGDEIDDDLMDLAGIG